MGRPTTGIAVRALSLFQVCSLMSSNILGGVLFCDYSGIGIHRIGCIHVLLGPILLSE